MKIQRRSGRDERRILTAMIVDELVLARITSKWEPDLFQSSWAQLVGGWCVDFYKRYSKAPKRDIEPIFEAWASEGDKDKDTVALVDKFLVSLDEEYDADELNVNYITDLAGRHFNEVKLKRLADGIHGDLDTGDNEGASNRVVRFGRVELGQGAGIDVLNDLSAWKEALTEDSQDLIVYPQALKHFFRGALTRDSFVALMAPEKRGKTFWLLDMAIRAVAQKRKVAFFSVGDMSQKQTLRRIGARLAKRPVKKCVLKVPTAITRDAGGNIEVSMDKRKFDRPLDARTAWRAIKKFRNTKSSRGESLFRLSTHPNSSITVDGIDSILQAWEREGWVADVVIIDYADILLQPDGVSDERAGVNMTWKKLRSLSQKQHCLVITATQADAGSYDTNLMSMSNFSEDKRKFAHVTGMFGINQNGSEKRDQLYRLNWLVLRESEFDTTKAAHVASCLGLCRPAVHSCF